MKKSSIEWIVCSLLLIFAHAAHADPVFDALKGAWAVENWHAVLVKTKSPLAAKRAASSRLTHLIFTGGSQSYVMDMLFNSGHEADRREFNKIRTADSGEAEYEFFSGSSGIQFGNTKVRVLNDRKILVSFTNPIADPAVFIRLGSSMEEFINQTVIAGHYTDKSGNIYVFGKNGTLDWKGERGTYEVYTDLGPNGKTDAIGITLKGQLIRYGFETQGATKLLYAVREDEWGEVKTGPALFVLKPIKR